MSNNAFLYADEFHVRDIRRPPIRGAWYVDSLTQTGLWPITKLGRMRHEVPKPLGNQIYEEMKETGSRESVFAADTPIDDDASSLSDALTG